LLIAIGTVGPLSINMYLPSMLGVARAFGVDFTVIQLTFSFFRAAMVLCQLIIMAVCALLALASSGLISGQLSSTPSQ